MNICEKGWSVDEINEVLPVNYHLENLSYEADEYRKQNNYPNSFKIKQIICNNLYKGFTFVNYKPIQDTQNR